MNWEIHITTKSDATFGRGDGVSGLVDTEVEHDTWGLPFVRGRTLKGLLVEECANILYAMRQHPKLAGLEQAAAFLFGREGDRENADGCLAVSDARLPTTLCDAVRQGIEKNQLTREDVLASLTDLRRQTAVDEETGASARGSLRSLRVVLRDTAFIAPLRFQSGPDDVALALLTACLSGLRRAGTGRNRGRGRLTAALYRNGADQQPVYWPRFKNLLESS